MCRLKELGICVAEQQQDAGGKAAVADADDAQPTVAASMPPIADRNVFPLKRVLGVKTQPRPCIMIEIELPQNHRATRMKNDKEREEYW
jgi:hypothetical protein